MVARRLPRILLVAASLLSVAAWGVSPAQANSLCVNQGGTNGCHGTIAEAIAVAANGDTIHIAGGSAYVEHLTIAKSLSLVGDDANTTIIDGASLGQVLRVTGTVTVSLTNLTIRHGHPSLGDTPDQWGGGIHNEFATLTLNHVIVTFNQSGGDNLCCAGNGGGIYNHQATLTLNHSTVSFNSTASPGSNEAPGQAGYNGGNGGGIFNDAGVVVVNDSLINGNVTGSGSDGDNSGGFGGFGGGIDSAHGFLTLNRSSVSGNVTGNGGSGTSGGPGGNGGGINDDMGQQLTISASTISGNQTGTGGSGSGFGRSGVGGGVAIDGTGAYVPGRVAISDATISANATGLGESGSHLGEGGGLFEEFANPVNITNTTVAYNSVDTGQTSGGIAAGFFGVVTLKNSLVAYNHTAAGPGAHVDCAGTLNSLGYNAILTTVGCTITATVGDQFSPLGLTLAPLANNGGATLTNALPLGSVAVDAADNSTCPANDQRGFHRPVFGGVALRCDIGAFELYRVNLRLPLVVR